MFQKFARLATLRHDPLLANSFFLLLSTVAMAGFGFVFWLLVARVYRPEQVGVASTLITAMNFLADCALIGCNTAYIHFLPKLKSRSAQNIQIDTGLLIVLIAGVLLAGGYAIFAPLFAPGLHLLHGHWYFGLGFVLLTTAAAVNLVTDSIFVAYRAAKYNFIINGLIASATQLSLPLLLIGLGAYGVFASSAISLSVAMILSLAVLVKRFGYRIQPKLDKTVLREVARYSLLNYVANILELAPTVILPIIILNALGAASAGYYYLAFMMATLLYTIGYALSESLFAEGSYAERELTSLLKKAFTTLLVVMLPAALLLAMVGPYLMSIFGPTYAAASRAILPILALSAPFVAAHVLSLTVLRVLKRNWQVVMTNVVFCGVIIVLAIIWAKNGLWWVGLAWLVGNVVAGMFGWMYILCRRSFYHNLFHKNIANK